jgi:hypothetical protein
VAVAAGVLAPLHGIAADGARLALLAAVRDVVSVVVRQRPVTALDAIGDAVAVAVWRRPLAGVRDAVRVRVGQLPLEDLAVVNNAVAVAVGGPFDDIAND